MQQNAMKKKNPRVFIDANFESKKKKIKTELKEK